MAVDLGYDHSLDRALRGKLLLLLLLNLDALLVSFERLRLGRRHSMRAGCHKIVASNKVHHAAPLLVKGPDHTQCARRDLLGDGGLERDAAHLVAHVLDDGLTIACA